MQQRGEPSRALLRLAAAQEDVLTREQALGLGLSRHTLSRLVAQRQWQRMAPGLFVTHSGAVTWPNLAWGGVLLGGEGARLGGSAAAYAQGLVDEAPDQVQVFVPHDVIARRRSHWVFVRERPGARSPRTTGSPPRTLAADTVLDLCESASARAVEDLVTRAVQRRLTTPQQVLRALSGRGRHSCRVLLTEILTDVDEGAESPLELRYLRDVERPHRLPRGRRQKPSADQPALRDVLYEAYAFIVELDGRKGHEGEGRFRDMRRDNAALLARLSTVRYGFGDVAGSPCDVAWEVARLLEMRGWRGPFTRCKRCPTVRW
ncbi:MAG: type IV toxin-antitoxin system AbiEi family antitoxin domain-containing protein [Janthinobacterium lividum]